MRDLAALREAPLHTFNEWEVDAYLRWLTHQGMKPTERVVLLARKNIGQPYRLSLLGEYPFELRDADPMVCLSASDCVTFVEQTYAMALSEDWASFFRMLQRIRYKDGQVGLLTRNHFTEADWNVNNAWLFEDVTEALSGGAAEPLRVRVDRAGFFAPYGIGQGLPVEVFEDTYLPRGKLAAALDGLRDGDVVQIVRGEASAPFVGHIGLIVHDGEGGISILHSGRPRVREEPLVDYVAGHPKVLGLKVLRLRASVNERGDR